MDIQLLQQQYISLYHTTPRIYKSPGRINIIGEHTDYNEGFVLPAAIDKAVYVAIDKRVDEEIHLYAANYQESYQTAVNQIKPSNIQWTNYILGVINELQKLSCILGGFNLYIDGDIPGGAGLSSSAAVACAVAYALNEEFSLGLSKMQLVKVAQQAEHHYAGVMCGIMDQFASVFGKQKQAIMLDCKTLTYQYVPINMPGYKFVLFNTNVKHNLASTAYNDRRATCLIGVQLVKEKYPNVNSLRDVSISMLDECIDDYDIHIKCKFVIEEIDRLKGACIDLENNNLVALGQKMFATHEGLSKDYEVSCKELDFLVEYVKNKDQVLGARMMGGGFGGCTINIVKEGSINQLIATIEKAYEAHFGIALSTYIVVIGIGAEEVSLI